MTTTRTPLPILQEKLARLCIDRKALYELSVRKGHLKPAVADAKSSELAEITSLFGLLVTYADELRAVWPEVRRLHALRLEADEASLIANHPAVTAVQAAFPGSTVSAVTPLDRGGGHLEQQPMESTS